MNIIKEFSKKVITLVILGKNLCSCLAVIDIIKTIITGIKKNNPKILSFSKQKTHNKQGNIAKTREIIIAAKRKSLTILLIISDFV